MRTFFILLALIAFSGCATDFEPQPLSPGHPASVQAQEAPRPRMKRLLTADRLTQETSAALARKTTPHPDYQGSGMSPDMGGMKGMDHSAMKETTPSSTGDKTAKSPTAPAVYTCLMHPEVQQSKPGNCPKCGMTLLKKETAAP